MALYTIDLPEELWEKATWAASVDKLELNSIIEKLLRQYYYNTYRRISSKRAWNQEKVPAFSLVSGKAKRLFKPPSSPDPRGPNPALCPHTRTRWFGPSHWCLECGVLLETKLL